MVALFHPACFANIAHFALMAQGQVVFEVEDNFQKQTYRNRCHIYSPNGLQVLTIPIQHTKSDGHQKTKDVRIDGSMNWQKQHWKSLETAYRTSPFFEYYEDELYPLFAKKFSFLLDFNFEAISLLLEFLQIDMALEKTNSYQLKPETEKDFRQLINAKKGIELPFEKYTQVFAEKHGFLSNLSVLDLLFNEGPNGITYLERQTVNF